MKKSAFLFLLLCCLGGMLTLAQDPIPPTPRPRPAPFATLNGEGFSVERYFSQLKQGGVGVLRLVGDVSEARAYFRGRDVPFRVAEDGLYALIVADLDTQPREYPLQFLVALNDGNTRTLDTMITITSGGYFSQNFTVPPERAYLLNPEVERNEFARIDALISSPPAQKWWDDNGFQAPIDSEFVSAFGLYRVLNSTVQTRHTGWDQQAPIGTPVASIGRGEVAFVGQLDIRGNYVLIYHGWGVYSGYAHFSQVNVAVGQVVQKGELIGMSGNTGRSSGPHLHWEVLVNGDWVDCVDFLAIWLP